MTQLGSSTTSTITSNGSWNLDPSVCTSIANGTELEVQPPQLMLDSVQLTTVDGTLSYSGNINDPIIVNLNVQHIADYASELTTTWALRRAAMRWPQTSAWMVVRTVHS